MSEYSSLETLKGREAIRKLPGMYISRLGSWGYTHLLYEVIDNAVDEALAGFCDNIVVRLANDGMVSVQDNGRGIPIGLNDDKVSYLVKAFEVHSGGKFIKQNGNTAYKQSGGLHGVGIAIVAALSSKATCSVVRDNMETVVQFSKGLYGCFDHNNVFSEKPDTFLQQFRLKKSDNKPVGTLLEFYIDHEFMDSDEDENGNVLRAEILFDELKDRLENTAYLVPNLTIKLVDEREENNTKVYEFNNPNGIVGLVESISSAKLVNNIVFFDDTGSYVTRGENKDLSVSVGFAWENSNRSNSKTFTNIIRTGQGGTHETGFIRGLHQVVVEQASKRGVLKVKDPEIIVEDVLEGLNYVVAVSLPRPTYSSQTKERLTEQPVMGIVKNITITHVQDWFNSKANSKQCISVLEKIVSAARSRKARDSKFNQKDVQASVDRKTVLGLKPANLKDCSKHGAGKGSELFIVEGLSALGSLLKTRDSSFQAVFPLRGKPFNVYGVGVEKLFIPPEKHNKSERQKFIDKGHLLLQNKEFDDLVQVINAGFGDEFDYSKRDFDKICIATDADIDGLHICCLLFVFFFLYMRPLVENGALYVTQPPLFVVDYVDNNKKKQVKYLLSTKDKDDFVELCKKQKYKIVNVGRRKGLGESTDEEMFTALMNPETRILKQVDVNDVKEAVKMLDLLFGNNTSVRKQWIQDPRVIELIEE